MPDAVVGLEDVDRTMAASVGAKGANLGELRRIPDIAVPDSFCVTTDAFRRAVSGAPGFAEGVARLGALDARDRPAVRMQSDALRRTIADAPVPDDVAAAVSAAVRRHADEPGWAVRSSATFEDLPTASSAGQQDTYLNIVGPDEVLRHVRRCWASLFTERSVAYRNRRGIDHRSAELAVVVQRMVAPSASGVLFTADPVTSDRTLSIVEATIGLGEPLVAGRATADVVTVRHGAIVSASIAAKSEALRCRPGGGTRVEAVAPAQRGEPALTPGEALRLVEAGTRIAAHFGSPQDIEWCLVDGRFSFVQSRAVTTLFPVPAGDGSGGFHVYLSVGHQQMMTDPIRPLGISFWQMTALPPMHEAGGRLFVDATPRLASPTGRAAFLEMIGRSDPLTRDALDTLLARDGVLPTTPDSDTSTPPGGPPPGGPPEPIATDPAVVTDLIDRNRASVAGLRDAIASATGPTLFDAIRDDIPELRRLLFDPRSHQVFLSAMDATHWLNEHVETWFGEKNAADVLTQSVPHNVTSEMGLALLDVADTVRPHPEVVDFLRGVEDGTVDPEHFLEELADLTGGREALEAIRAFLGSYGVRCVGEIDITRPRWSERPATLVPVILANVRNFTPGAGPRRFEQGRLQAEAKERELLERVRTLPDGAHLADEVATRIDRVRTFIGYREYPKFGMVSRYAVYKEALRREAERLVDAGVLRDREDIYFLTFDELEEAVRSGRADHDLLRRRRDEFGSYAALTPPRVLTSDGECLSGSYRRDDVPADALVGLAVSAGTVEGRARVVLDLADAELGPGDILVTAYADPSWTPLFVAASGLVTEVGGLMTHGAVIAREYGLPAVVGVADATRRIADGQRIRLHGTDGFVELLG